MQICLSFQYLGDGTGSKWLEKMSALWADLLINYKAAYETGKLHTGHILITYSDLLGQGYKVALAVTRSASCLTAREMTIRNILKALQEYCRENNINKVAMTRLGHKEGLSWDHWIKRQYVQALEYETNTEFDVFLY